MVQEIREVVHRGAQDTLEELEPNAGDVGEHVHMARDSRDFEVGRPEHVEGDRVHLVRRTQHQRVPQQTRVAVLPI